jgi:thiosulfate/3-mercaptopyruvate sulfurtransferase
MWMAEEQSALVSPDWLQARLDDPNVRIVALNWRGRQDYERGHIPGAVYWEWKDMLWDPLRRDFPTPEEFARRCGAAGIGNDTTVVCYGNPAVQFGTYGWWVFKYCGHRDVRVLDGAMTRWVKEGRPISTEEPRITPVVYRPSVNAGARAMRAMRDEVAAALDDPTITILDHRSPEEFRGELYSPPGSPNHGAERLGHIPGAKHLHFEDFVGPDTSFKSPSEIRRLLEARGATADRKIISYCRLSHRATLAYFAMTQLLGYKDVRSYDGSWTEWGSLVGAPVEK